MSFNPFCICGGGKESNFHSESCTLAPFNNITLTVEELIKDKNEAVKAKFELYQEMVSRSIQAQNAINSLKKKLSLAEQIIALAGHPTCISNMRNCRCDCGWDEAVEAFNSYQLVER